MLSSYSITYKIVFLKTYAKHVVEKLFPNHFLKNQNWAYFLINGLKFHLVCFHCVAKVKVTKHIETKVVTTGLYLIRDFLRNKKRSGTSLLASFSVWLLQKIISINWPNFIVWLTLIFKTFGNIFTAIVCVPVCDVIFWNLL